MEVERDEVLEPMSPNAQYLMSSALTLTIFGVMELEFPFDCDSTVTTIVNDFILPLNPRFSSIVEEKKGVRKWKRVEVNLKGHVYYPIFPSEMTVEYYDECFTEYLSKLSTEHFPENRPLWELHIVKYPTKNAAGNIIFKMHHSIGDGYSIIGSLLSRLKRVDDPLMPLTYPSRQSNSNTRRNNRLIPRLFTSMVHTQNQHHHFLFRLDGPYSRVIENYCYSNYCYF